MINLRPFTDLGHANYGWLNANYHFSFARYYNPQRMGFGVLRVVNDDRVAAGEGFDPHPHEDMEIITYVRQGEIRHRDNLGNEGTTPAGDVQVMSAGSGITHAEYASQTEPTVLYQIWILPREKGVEPRWQQATFPKQPVSGNLRLLVSGFAEDKAGGALYIHQNARLWGGKLTAGSTLTQDFGPRAYVLASQGTFTLNQHTLHQGDAAAVEQEGPLTFTAQNEAEVVVIELPL